MLGCNHRRGLGRRLRGGRNQGAWRGFLCNCLYKTPWRGEGATLGGRGGGGGGGRNLVIFMIGWMWVKTFNTRLMVVETRLEFTVVYAYCSARRFRATSSFCVSKNNLYCDFPC